MIFKKIDSVYIVFATLIIFLLVSFYYSVKIEKDVKAKYQNMAKVERLILLNLEIDTFLVKRLKHINFDIVSQNILDFKMILKDLNKSDIRFIKDTNTIKAIFIINQKFKKKRIVVEKFKSNTGLFISSVHYLLSINNVLQKSYYFSPIILKTQKISLSFTQSLFEKRDLLEISHVIKELKNLFKSNKLVDPQIKSFIEHSNSSLKTINVLDDLIVQKEVISLNKSLLSLKTIMQNNFEKSAKEEKFLQYILFVVDVIILLLLISTYMSMKLSQQNLSRFKNAVENSDNIIIITDIDHKITYVNDAFVNITGYTKNEIIGKKPNILKSGRMSKEFYENLHTKLKNNEKWEGEFVNQKKDGSLYHEATSIVPIMNKNEVEGYLAIKLDITNYVEQQEELFLKTTRLNEAQKIAQIGNWELSLKSSNIHVSNEVMRIFEFEETKKNMLFNEFLKYIHTDDKTKVILAFKQHISSEYNKNLEFKIVTCKNKPKHLQIYLHKKFDKNGELIAINGTVQDISKLVLAREEINFIAYHDHLTKLDNRIAFENKLEHAINLAKRRDKTFAVIFIDLDRFKIVNDTLGHQVGDKLLKIISQRLKNTIRESDTIARLGGDEFGIFLETTTTSKEVEIVAEKILNEVQLPVKFDNYSLDVTASIGISLYPQNGDNTESLLKNADSAMYFAKDRGKNNFQFFTETLSQEVYRRHNIEQSMKTALINEEFSLVYQPQYALNTKKVIGYEVLLRWYNEELGSISPVEFIPIAEDSGMIVSIGEWILKEACKTYIKLEKLGVAPDIFSINVSSIQFRQKNFIKTFLNIIEEAGVRPSSIELEITESYLVEINEENLTSLARLRERGFSISVDDFGTGYSSMSYLKHLPLDTLKIDKSFVDDTPHNKSDVAVVQAIITLANSFGFKIVAEGIETQEQEHFLKKYGCEIGQGYLFSKPLNLNDLIDFLE